MKQFTYVITDEAGIHARPAGLLVKEAAKFASSTTIAKGAKKGVRERLHYRKGRKEREHHKAYGSYGSWR